MKKYCLYKIKTRSSYTPEEVCELLGVCCSTVRLWVKQGLPVIRNTRPYLIQGSNLKAFLFRKTQQYKYVLSDNEFPCFKCRKGVLPVPDSIRERIANKIGKGKRTIVLEAQCSICKSEVRRFDARLELSCIGEPKEFRKNELKDMPLFQYRRTG